MAPSIMLYLQVLYPFLLPITVVQWGSMYPVVEQTDNDRIHASPTTQDGSDNVAHHARCCNLYLVDPLKSVRARGTDVEQ